MKKFNKFLGIFLALAMVIGLIPVVGAVETETPTAPAAPNGAILQSNTLEAISSTKLVTKFGYYQGDDIDDPTAFVDCGDGAFVTDGLLDSTGYSKCTLDDGTIGLIINIDEVTTIDGIQIVCNDVYHSPSVFFVEALVDESWTELFAIEENIFTDNLTKMFNFETVETDTVRIVIDDVPLNDDGQVCFNEVTLFKTSTETPTETPTQETTQAPTQETTQAPTQETTQAPTVPTGNGFWLDHIPNLNVTPYIGYYTDITGNIINDPGEDVCVMAGLYGRTAFLNDLLKADLASGAKTGAILLKLSEATLVGALEITGDAGHNMTKFEIQVKDETGAWVTVKTVTENPFTENQTQRFTFDPVVGTEVRVLITDYETNSDNRVIVTDMMLFAAKTGRPLVQIPVTEDMVTLDKTPGSSVNNAFDGDKTTYTEVHNSGSVPVVIFTINTTKDGAPTLVNRLMVYGNRHNGYSPDQIKVEVQTEAGGAWTQVFAGTAYQFCSNGSIARYNVCTVDFDSLAYAVRLSVDSTNGGQLRMNEVELFGFNPNYVEPEQPTTPTEPTQEPTQAPTQEPTPAPTQEPTPAPTQETTQAPTQETTQAPTQETTQAPTQETTQAPTETPTQAPTQETTAAPTQPALPGNTYLQLIPESSLEAFVGDYVNGDFENLVNQDPGEAAYLTDVAIGTAGYIGSASISGTQAAVIVLNETKMVGGVELIARKNDYLTKFEIQVNTTANGWVTVANVTEDPFDGCRSVKYTWTPVEATSIRVLCYAWSSNRPMLQEVTVYEAKTGVMSEVVPNSVICPQSAMLPETAVDNVIDGFRGDYTYDYFQTPANAAQLTFDLTKNGAASDVSRVIVYAFATNKYTPASITLDLETAEGWVNVYNGVAYTNGATDTFVLDFDQTYAATTARLTVNSTLSEGLILTEVDFFGIGEPVDPEQPTTPTTPADPTAPSTPAEPTVPSTPAEPTVPSTPAEPTVPSTPAEPTVPSEPTGNGFWLDHIPNLNVTPYIGYYTDITGNIISVPGEDVCVMAGLYGRTAYLDNLPKADLESGAKTGAILLKLSEATLIGALEITGEAGHNMTKFEIQVKDESGAWVTVKTVTENPFTENQTQRFTFDPVVGTEVRVLITDYETNIDNRVIVTDMMLFAAKTGRPLVQIPVTEDMVTLDKTPGSSVNNAFDGDKTTYTEVHNAGTPPVVVFTINTTKDGAPTLVNRLMVYGSRHDGYSPDQIKVEVQTEAGGAWTQVFAGTAYQFCSDGSIARYNVCTVDFDQDYLAYSVRLTVDSTNGGQLRMNEIELFGFDPNYVGPVEPPVDPEEPTTPTDPSTPADPTDPSTPADPTVPSEPTDEPEEPTVPSEPTDEPEEPTVPSEPTDEPEEPTVPSEPTDEPEEPGEDLPETPERPGVVDISDIQETIDLIYKLDPNEYTAESYENLVAVVKEVNKIITTQGGYTQDMIDRANEMLTDALAALVPVNGGTGTPDGDGDFDAPDQTGDIALTVLSSMMTLSAIGGAVIIGKKKFF